jgi:mannosyltransferase
LLLSFALRFYRLDAQSLWADEGASIVQAGRSLSAIAFHTARDIHPPLYYYLLHFWVQFLGDGEIAVRSLSAILGVLLVGLIFLLGRRLADPADNKTGLVAAFVAALSPFQVYYSQEARMYILLAALGAATVYAALRYVEAEHQAGAGLKPAPTEVYLWAAVYVLAAAGGLYTHYAFPAVLAAVNLAYLAAAWRDGPGWRRVGRWLLLQCGALLLFAPWLPTAYRQVTGWPAPAQPVPPDVALKTPLRLLGLGLSPDGPGTEWLAAGFAVLALIGLWAATKGPRSTFHRLLLPLYLLLPVLLTVALFKPAYLKFLLVASPAFCLAVGQGLTLPWRMLSSRRLPNLREGLRWGWLGLGLLFVGLVSALSLRNYYFDPRYARDDYRGIARYVEAAGRDGDAIILNAPGQEEIFGYYYEGDLPIYPLPRQRPPDEAQTVEELAELARRHERIFALFWATAESDPQGLVEGWLDGQAYKAWDAWHGNVRLAIYATPATGQPAVEEKLDARLGAAIVLQGYQLYRDKVLAGDILPVTLLWKAEEIPATNYKVFVHVVDRQGRVAAQRDSEPLGGRRPTTSWQPGEIIEDNYGILIPPGTPPGSYRLLAGMYDPADGARLPVSLGEQEGLDSVPLGEVAIVTSPPATIFAPTPTPPPADPLPTPGPAPGVAPGLPPIEPTLVTHGDRSLPYIALTFDACQTADQPAGYDEDIIRILTETDTPATLFLGGLWMQWHPAQTRSLAASPLFELGNHSWSHPNFAHISPEAMSAEILGTQNTMYKLTGQQPTLFRFPYDAYNDEALAVVGEHGLRVVRWDIAPGDPDPRTSAQDIADAVTAQAKNGSIIIMHMNNRGWHTAEALPVVIERLRDEGYTFVTVSQLLELALPPDASSGVEEQ